MHGCLGVAGDICFSCVRRCQGRPNVPAMNKMMKLWALTPSLLRTCPHHRHCVAAFPDSVNNPGKDGFRDKNCPIAILGRRRRKRQSRNPRKLFARSCILCTGCARPEFANPRKSRCFRFKGKALKNVRAADRSTSRGFTGVRVSFFHTDYAKNCFAIPLRTISR
jgi:hypothetical protein